MIIPVRCFTCGALIADKWDEFKIQIQEGEDSEKTLDKLNVKRWCCRRMLVSHIDLIEDFLPFT
ncbi:MAG: DNA-directed RNA polymerase subunit N [Candidatus Heimdallarchaeota archaeon]|nr:DNA-directed RNA polymerase subunit N [Candidatus Heimdallarchaeota archaeon]